MPIEISKPGINVREQLNALRTPVSEAGSRVMRSDSTYEQVALLGLQPNNLFINGDQRIWQRGTTQTGIGTSSETVVSDRWRNYQSGTSGRCTWERDSDAPDGHEYSAKISVTTADTSVAANHRWNIAYRMDADVFAPLGFGTNYAVGFTIQFWVKTNKVGTYCIDAYKNGTAPTATRQFTIHEGGVWQHVVLTWPPSVYAASGDPSFWIWLQAGSDYTDDRGTGWATATDGRAHGMSVNLYDSTSNYFKITGIQMTKGQVSSGLPFDHRCYGEELALCQRYYVQYELASYQRLVATSYCDINNRVQVDIALPVPLRAYVSAGHTNLTITGQAVNVINLSQTGSNGNILTGNFTCPGTPLTVGAIYQVYAIGTGNFYVNGEF